jgi:hypothetical protein
MYIFRSGIGYETRRKIDMKVKTVEMPVDGDDGSKAKGGTGCIMPGNIVVRSQEGKH